MFRADGEPPLSDLLADSTLHLLLTRDGITLDELRRLIDDFRERQAPRRPSKQG
jgi:hypothetical protein